MKWVSHPVLRKSVEIKDYYECDIQKPHLCILPFRLFAIYFGL